MNAGPGAAPPAGTSQAPAQPEKMGGLPSGFREFAAAFEPIWKLGAGAARGKRACAERAALEKRFQDVYGRSRKDPPAGAPIDASLWVSAGDDMLERFGRLREACVLEDLDDADKTLGKIHGAFDELAGMVQPRALPPTMQSFDAMLRPIWKLAPESARPNTTASTVPRCRRGGKSWIKSIG